MILTVIVLSTLLIFSFLAIGLLIWYNRQATDKLFYISDNIGATLGLVEEYQEHLESLYEMEMFYGDATLEGLMKHTKFIVEEIKEFEEIYSLTNEEEEEVEIDEEGRDNPTS